MLAKREELNTRFDATILAPGMCFIDERAAEWLIGYFYAAKRQTGVQFLDPRMWLSIFTWNITQVVSLSSVSCRYVSRM